MRGTFVNLGINMHIFRCFPVKVFFILMCVITLMVPVSAERIEPPKRVYYESTRN